MSNGDIYEKYCNTRRLLDKFVVDTGFFLSELILFTNRYKSLLSLGKKVAVAQKPLCTRLELLDERTMMEFKNDVEYSMQCTTDIKRDYKCYQHIGNHLQLSFIEYLTIYTTLKYNIETEMPYKLDRFMFFEYKSMLTTMLNADTIIMI